MALPDKLVEAKKFPKPYLCNLIYTLVGDDFKQWVKTQINTRNERVAVEANLNIEMDPAIAAAFNNSTAVSR